MRRLCISILIFVVIVLSGEMVCRLSGINDNYRMGRPSRISREDIDLVYRLREDLDLEAPLYNVLRLEPDVLSGQIISTFHVRTNAIGLREEQSLPASDTTSLIIMCMGDSVTFGWGADGDESYPRILEGLLNQCEGRRIRVINSAQPGFSSCQGLHFYRQVLRDIPSDFVIVAFGHNDHSIAIQGYRSARDKFTKLSQGAGRYRFWLRRSDFYLCWLRLVTGIVGRCRLTLFSSSPVGLDNPGSVREFEEHLTELVGEIRRDDRGVLLMTQPRNTSESTWLSYNKAMRHVAETTGTPLFDASMLFDTLPDERNEDGQRSVPPNGLFLDDIHLTPQGNTILARAIAEYLFTVPELLEIRRQGITHDGGNARNH